MNETILIEKLIKIEALFAGATTLGERLSADLARQRILMRLKELLPKDPAIEYKFTFVDMWSRKVFVALLRRYDLKPYRYYRQRYTTVMVKVPESFLIFRKKEIPKKEEGEREKRRNAIVRDSG